MQGLHARFRLRTRVHRVFFRYDLFGDNIIGVYAAPDAFHLVIPQTEIVSGNTGDSDDCIFYHDQGGQNGKQQNRCRPRLVFPCERIFAAHIQALMQKVFRSPKKRRQRNAVHRVGSIGKPVGQVFGPSKKINNQYTPFFVFFQADSGKEHSFCTEKGTGWPSFGREPAAEKKGQNQISPVHSTVPEAAPGGPRQLPSPYRDRPDSTRRARSG